MYIESNRKSRSALFRSVPVFRFRIRLDQPGFSKPCLDEPLEESIKHTIENEQEPDQT